MGVQAMFRLQGRRCNHEQSTVSTDRDRGAIATVALTAACGGSSSATPSSAPSGSTPATGGSNGSSGGANALVGEANAAAAGDIPDNQVFLTFANQAEGYTIKYPEGWAQQGSGASVTFRDRNNEMRIVADQGQVTPSAVAADVQQLTSQTAGFKVVSPPVEHPTCTNAGKTVQLPLAAAKVVYETQSQPNSVTGKKVTLVVDRYYLGNGGKRAIIDLGSPKDVDNVDAFCLMASSFKWK
jgi:hypothetical protein